MKYFVPGHGGLAPKIGRVIGIRENMGGIDLELEFPDKSRAWADQDNLEGADGVARLDDPSVEHKVDTDSAASMMRPATDEDRKRLKIPPAWTDVIVANDPDAPLQAKGKDAKGRPQSKYSDAHHAKAAEKKFARMKRLHELLPKLDQALADDDLSDDTAAAVYLIRTMGLRNGSENDTKADKFAYGATNLRAKHVLVDGDDVTLDFDAKDNQRITLSVTDERLKEMLRERKAARGDDDRMFVTDGTKTNKYLKTQTGDEFKIKDLRTYLANQEALAIIKTMPKPQTEAEFKKARMEVARRVAAILGNTPIVALGSYLSAVVFDSWLRDAPWLQ